MASRNPRYGLFALAVCLVGMCMPPAILASPPRPNIVVVLTDDQGYADLSSHGHPILSTPNLDRLEREGRSFTNFFVSPTCAPTRSALMTGRHEFYNGVTHTVLERERLARSATTLAETLQQSGYATGIFGKWHLGDEPEYRPNRRGFEESWIHGGGGIGQSYPGSCGDAPGNHYFNPWLLHNDRFEPTTGYCTDVFMDRALDWMDRIRSSDRPFFCWIATNAPHDPYHAKTEDAMRYAGRGLDAHLQHFYGMIHNVDANVGRLLDQLDRWDIADNTLVIFMNDNGSAMGSREFNAGMRGAKGGPWLGGTRANAFWRWPGRIAPGPCDALTAHIDLFPTLAHLAQAPLSAAAQSQIQGRDLTPLLNDPSAPWSDRHLITHVGRWPQGANPEEHRYKQCAIRDPRYTLVSTNGGREPRWQLFDVQRDPGQTTNLIEREPEIASQLAGQYDRWWDDMRPHLVNEDAVGPSENPFRSLFREQHPEIAIDPATHTGSAPPKPNILWIVIEDMSPNFGCYGESTIATPNLDRLASEGVRFRNAFTTAPICSTSRSALITGRYQTSIQAHHHRSSVPGHLIQLPNEVQLVPAQLTRAGYHCNNLTFEDFVRDAATLTKNDRVTIAKTDYNFEWNPKECYADQHWSARQPGRPFFVQVQLHGGKFRGQAPLPAWPQRVQRELGSTTDSASVQLPPILPDDPVMRADWAQYLDCVRYTDFQVGAVLNRLRDEGVLENTWVFLITDHGISHVRHKQFLYDGGLHIPMLVRGPGLACGSVREDLVEHIDLAATALVLAGLPVPSSMHARPLFSPAHGPKLSPPREAVFAARDRADETVDAIRSARTKQFKYIRNGFPNRPYLQPNAYKDSKAIVQAMRRLHAAGQLSEAQSRLFSDTRPLEELYDLSADPHELNNLAEHPDMQSQLLALRAALATWRASTNDPAAPEDAATYDLEVATEHVEGGKNSATPEFRANLELMKRWRSERPFVPFP